MAEITVDRACELLTLAASGQFTIDAEFKSACRFAVSTIRKSERLADTLRKLLPPVAETKEGG